VLAKPVVVRLVMLWDMYAAQMMRQAMCAAVVVPMTRRAM
jgi:hypothetical protein